MKHKTVVDSPLCHGFVERGLHPQLSGNDHITGTGDAAFLQENQEDDNSCSE